MHHWNICTAETLAPNAALQRAMRECIPALAVNHRYLMHAMLALTSLHMAYLHPTETKEYESRAAHHHSLAVPLFRSALANVTESSSHALYACGHLVIKYTFASPQSRRNLIFSPATGTSSEIIGLLRGAFSMHGYAEKWLSNGPLGFCMERPLDETPDFSQNPDDSYLVQLLYLLLADCSEESNLCCAALNSLRRLLAMAATPGQTISVKTLTYSWPVQVPQKYITLVGEGKPKALVVLAHYCVMLKMLDSFWFMEGCAARILEQCRQNLESQWHRYIEWPLSIVGVYGGEV